VNRPKEAHAKPGTAPEWAFGGAAKSTASLESRGGQEVIRKRPEEDGRVSMRRSGLSFPRFWPKAQFQKHTHSIIRNDSLVIGNARSLSDGLMHYLP